MSKNFLNVFIVSISTFGSRILGLFRDILIFSFFGTGVLNSAFILAFTLPNLFRRLLGEGSLTSAFVPVFSEALEHNQRPGAFQLLNKTLSRFGLLLLGLVLLGVLLLGGVCLFPGLAERWYLGAHFGIILLPYMILVCLAAVMAGALNVLRYFTVPALSAIWLNLAIILSLGGVGYLLASEPEAQIYYLCGGVLVGGVIQVLAPLWVLRREGWRPQFDWQESEEMQEVKMLFLPGALGAAILQINVLVSRLLAFSLNTEAVSFLYLANRLVELPLGIFTMAVATVIFPALSQLAARGDVQAFTQTFYQGVRLILAITIPAALGLGVLHRPILTLLFEWGVFNARDVAMTGSVLCIFAAGLPFYSLAILATRGLHALKDTKTVMWIACWTFVANLMLCLILMQVLDMEGLALANVLSVAFQSFALYRLLCRKGAAFQKISLVNPIVKVVLAALGMSILCLFGLELINELFGKGKGGALVVVAGLVPLAMGAYLCLLWIFGFEDLERLKTFLLKIRQRFR